MQLSITASDGCRVTGSEVNCGTTLSRRHHCFLYEADEHLEPLKRIQPIQRDRSQAGPEKISFSSTRSYLPRECRRLKREKAGLCECRAVKEYPQPTTTRELQRLLRKGTVGDSSEKLPEAAPVYALVGRGA